MNFAYARTFAICGLAFLVMQDAQADEFENLVQRCAPTVAPDTLRALVKTESNFNPYAIGVVGGRVEQPKAFHEAMSTIAELELAGKNYSVGIAQINKHNFAKYGINAGQALDACTNLRVAAAILGDCYSAAKRKGVSQEKALHDALSCYYSGNFKSGYTQGYVNQVRKNAGLPSIVPSIGGRSFEMNSEKTEERSSAPLVSSVNSERRGFIF